jgi:5-(aminomethyl)-3-furanmethanol phosphate kinase
MIVVKLGGSLYDHPALRTGLNRWLETLPAPVFLVPGGGAFADAVRELDRIHSLGECAAHELAMQSLLAAADFVHGLVEREGVHVVDSHEYCRRNDGLPHSWDVTTDSIALFLAMRERADRLILLKSQGRPMGTWNELGDAGYVDRHFPKLADATNLTIECVDFRNWLDDQRNVDSR